MSTHGYDYALEQEAIREYTAERLELGMSELTEEEISLLFEHHFTDLDKSEEL